jgi:hypothetical protein
VEEINLSLNENAIRLKPVNSKNLVRKRNQMKTKALIYTLLLSCLILTSCSGGIGSGEVQRVAITNIHLVPMTEEIILENYTVLSEGSRIVAVASASEIKIPKDATVIDGKGAYLMPGLADMHMHTIHDWVEHFPISPFVLYLANGVTTVRNMDPRPDPGDESISPDYALEWRDEILEGSRPGPTMYVTGISLQGPNDWRPVVLTAGDAEKVIQENVEGGYDFLKIFEYFPKEHFEEAITAAEKHDMYVTGHIPMEVGLEGALQVVWMRSPMLSPSSIGNAWVFILPV